MFNKIFFSLCLFSWLCGVAQAEYRSECFELGMLNGKYCITMDQDQFNGEVLYYFHGRGTDSNSMNERTWFDPYYYPEQIRQYWQEKQLKRPVIISLTFGPVWVLAEKNSSAFSGLFNVFVDHFVPAVEQKIAAKLAQPVQKRVLLGESMGGFNALQLAMKTKLFKKVAALCAPMAGISHLSSEAEIDAFINSGYWIERDEVLSALGIGQVFFPAQVEWDNANPLSLAANTEVANWPEMYVAVGFHDRFGSYPWNQKMAEIMLSRGGKVDWRPQWGGHCAIDIPSLATFLVK